jgi:predicted HAD superfamily Cof-like phosphohydrolase
MIDFKKVKEFHIKFEQLRVGLPLPDALFSFRSMFLHEEAREFQQAMTALSLPEAADSLIDLVYVACGTAYFMNLDWQVVLFRQEYVGTIMETGGQLAPRVPRLPDHLAAEHFSENVMASIRILNRTHDRFKTIAPDDRHRGYELYDILVKHCDAALRWIVFECYRISHVMGITPGCWYDLFDEVHRANMSKRRAKADGSDSKRGSPWDIIKPEGWVAPDQAAILKRHGWRDGSEGERV